ncbi:MAG TPA: hypothetical protein VMQ10_17260 [Spirochaetia bacterium]|nr:hypothetical protein [Spirochaetia bacterium]
MWQRSARGPYVETLLFTLSALVLFLTGIGLGFFLVPLQALASRRGFGWLSVGAVLFLAVIALVPPFSAAGPAAQALPMVPRAIVLAFGGVSVAGILLVNLPLRRPPRAVVRLVGAAALVGAVAAALEIARAPVFVQLVSALGSYVSQVFSAVMVAPGTDGGAAALLAQPGDAATVRALVDVTFPRCLAAGYLVELSFSWWLGQLLGRRRSVYGEPPSGFRLSSFRLESWWLWPLIAGGAAVLADLFLGLSGDGLAILAYAGWNIGFGVLFVFGLQGMAIVMFLFEKYQVPRILWFLLLAGLAVVVSRGRGVFFVLIIPVLGIAENWIRFRIPRRAAPTE